MNKMIPIEIIREIRIDAKKYIYRVVAEKYGVSTSYVSYVVNNKVKQDKLTEEQTNICLS